MFYGSLLMILEYETCSFNNDRQSTSHLFIDVCLCALVGDRFRWLEIACVDVSRLLASSQFFR